MTKERLEELIKQEGTVYEIHKLCRYIVRLKLRSSNYVSDGGSYLYDRCEAGVMFVLDNLYETKKQAEWALKTVTERIDRFEPPMWEEIEDYSYRFVWAKQFILLDIHKDDDDESDMSYIHIYNFTDNGYIFYKIGDDVTKENYEKACEIVRDLFKGEK